MEDIVSSPPSPHLRKRAAPDDETPRNNLLNLKGNQFVMPTPPDTDQSSNSSPDDHRTKSRDVSPAASSSALSSIESVSNPGLPDSNNASSAGAGANPPPAKRRKLTAAEKVEKQQVREAKEREKAASKAVKDEEKRVKDEEKRVKDEEKRKKAEEREAKKREKELEEERKTQEKLKKERAQMRLGAFFQAKPAASPQANDSDEGTLSHPRRKSLSLEPFDASASQAESSTSPAKGVNVRTPQRATAKTPTSGMKSNVLSDYKRTFLPFELPTHSQLAPMPQQERTSEELDADQETFDREVTNLSIQNKHHTGLSHSSVGLSQYFNHDHRIARGVPLPRMRLLVDQIQGTSTQPIDLTAEQSSVDPMERLRQISVRHLHFSEDVRPAYCGTYTRSISPTRTNRLRRNPCGRFRTDTNYDYDSEAEWEEPEEGEDLLSDEEEEADDPADVDDIEGFLDDEEDAIKNKRKMITGDMIPTSTGICWADSSGRLVPNDQDDQAQKTLRGMRLDVLLPGFHGKTIDPFSTEYWETEAVPAAQITATKETPDTNLAGLMAPPRQPLQQRLNTNASLESNLIGSAQGEKGPIITVGGAQGTKRGRKPAPKTLNTEDLEEFKMAVVGSPLGKLDLLKGLKSRFPKITQETIKDTLGSCFAQVGSSRADKKWVFVGPT